MCGRFSLSLDSATLKALFEAYADVSMDAWSPSWNVAPTQSAPVLEQAKDGNALTLRLRRWGSASKGRTLVNIRSEGLSSGRLSAKGLLRCAVPASSFYEWKRSGQRPIPYLISKQGGGILLLAALCEPGSEAFAIVTRSSSPPLDGIHLRAPLTLSEESLSLWLGQEKPFAALEARQAMLEMRRADPRVNSVNFNSPESQAPFDAPEEMQLL